MPEKKEACGKGSGDEVTQEKNVTEQNEQRAAEPNGEEEKSGLATLCEGILERLEFVTEVLHLFTSVIDDPDDRMKVIAETPILLHEACDKLSAVPLLLEIAIDMAASGQGMHGETGGAA